MAKGWIGVDLDGTLAVYDGWSGANQIGEPIQPMLDRVLQWLDDGEDVRIFTARVSGLFHPNDSKSYEESKTSWLAIDAWCKRYIGRSLPITSIKDFNMIALYDDRCVQVETNTGKLVCGEI
jgi:hypothetical protein